MFEDTKPLVDLGTNSVYVVGPRHVLLYSYVQILKRICTLDSLMVSVNIQILDILEYSLAYEHCQTHQIYISTRSVSINCRGTNQPGVTRSGIQLVFKIVSMLVRVI